jgi:hypothetical protein
MRTGQGDIIVTANNRSLYVAQEANLSNITVHGLDTEEGAQKMLTQLRLAGKKGGTGVPIEPGEIAIRKTPCG